MNDGRLGLLDFGCIRHYGAEERELVDLTEKFVDNRDAIPEFLRRGANAGEKELANPEYVGLVKEGCSWVLEPLGRSPFDFGDGSHLKTGIDWFSRIALKRYPKGHPMYLYWYRSIIGLKALLYRLRAQVDVKAVMTRERIVG
jgi:hypothetical protein